MKIGEVKRTPESRCPHCGYKLDAATCIGEDASPSAGDVTLCAKCVQWLMFGKDLQLVKPTKKARRHIAKDKRCQAVYAAGLAVRRDLNRKN